MMKLLCTIATTCDNLPHMQSHKLEMRSPTLPQPPPATFAPCSSWWYQCATDTDNLTLSLTCLDPAAVFGAECDVVPDHCWNTRDPQISISHSTFKVSSNAIFQKILSTHFLPAVFSPVTLPLRRLRRLRRRLRLRLEESLESCDYSRAVWAVCGFVLSSAEPHQSKCPNNRIEEHPTTHNDGRRLLWVRARLKKTEETLTMCDFSSKAGTAPCASSSEPSAGV